MKTDDTIELKKKKGLSLQKMLAPLALVIIYAFFLCSVEISSLI